MAPREPDKSTKPKAPKKKGDASESKKSNI